MVDSETEENKKCASSKGYVAVNLLAQFATIAV